VPWALQIFRCQAVGAVVVVVVMRGKSGDGEVGGGARAVEEVLEKVFVGGDSGAEGKGERIVQREGV
jgi:hypothetical protein